jgi:hypothetical protein
MVSTIPYPRMKKKNKIWKSGFSMTLKKKNPKLNINLKMTG